MSRKKILPYFLLLFLISSYSMQQIDGPRQCMIIQDKQTLLLPHEIPKFLTTGKKEMCRQSDSKSASLQCGNTGVYIKPECVCSFYNVYEGSYHTHSSCPGNEKSDDVTSLTCKDCMKYSVPNKGPCINGGNLTCVETGPDVVAPDIKCKCPPSFVGMFCENKMEKVTRICDRVDNSSSLGLKNCAETKMDCITYSEKEHYVFKCNETTATTNQGQVKLPLCNTTESTSLLSTVVTREVNVRNRGGLPSPHSISGAGAVISTFSLILFNSYTLRLI